MAADPSGNEVDYGKVPDTVIGIGGGGKRVLYHYLEQDWVLERGLTATGANPDPGFEAFAIDTATGEKPTDQDRIAKINEKITEVAKDLGRPESTTFTELEYVNPVDDESISRYTSNVGLASDVPVREIANNSSIRSWWLEDDDDMLLGGDYGSGVVRRRALSKALYHASKTGRNPLARVTENAEGSVAMITTLGGGTGSGMFLDIAKQLASSAGRAESINLFAILPGRGEKTRRKANAGAALAELEYLSMKDQSGDQANPFDNIILIPFEPARRLDDMSAFYDAMTYAIVARECMVSHDLDSSFSPNAPGDQPRSYAPFTVAYPQILRYPVGNIKQTEERINSFVNDKRETLEAEHELYDRLGQYVTEELNGEASDQLSAALDQGYDINAQLDSEDARDLRERVVELKQFVDQSQFDHTDHAPPQKWRTVLQNQLDDARNASDGQLQAEQDEMVATKVPKIATSLDPVDEEYRDEADRALERMIREELTAVRRRANLLKAVRLIESDAIREGIVKALDPDTGSLVASNRLQQKRGELIERIDDQFQRRLDSLEAFLDDETTHERVEQHVENWRSEVQPDLEAIVEIDEHRERAEELLEKLERNLETVAERVNGVNRPSGISTNPLEFSQFDELNRLLRQMGKEPVDERRIRDTVSSVAKAKQTYLEAAETGRLKRMLGSVDEKKKEFANRLDEIDTDLFHVTPADKENLEREFSCEYVGRGQFANRTDGLSDDRDRHLQNVVEAVRRYLRNPAVDQETLDTFLEETTTGTPPTFDELSWPGTDVEQAVTRVEEGLSGDLSDRTASELLSELVREGDSFNDAGPVRTAFVRASLRPVRDEQDRLDDKLGDERERANDYRALIEIVEDVGGTFEVDPTGTDAVDVEVDFGVDRDHTYIRQTKPTNDTGSLRGADDIADANLFEQEREAIWAHMKEFVSNATGSNSATQLDQRNIQVESARSGRTMYRGHFVSPVFMAPGLEYAENPGGSDSVFGRVEREIRSQMPTLEPQDDGCVRMSAGLADDWDIAMVTFIGGVVLDNLVSITDSDRGYLAAYERQEDELGRSIRVRHVQGVDGLDEQIVDQANRARQASRADGGDAEGDGDAGSQPADGDPDPRRDDAGFVRRRRPLDLWDTSEEGDLVQFIERSGNAKRLRDLLWDDGYVEFESFRSTIDID
jgi:hypothetical protein